MACPGPVDAAFRRTATSVCFFATKCCSFACSICNLIAVLLVVLNSAHHDFCHYNAICMESMKTLCRLSAKAQPQQRREERPPGRAGQWPCKGCASQEAACAGPPTGPCSPSRPACGAFQVTHPCLHAFLTHITSLLLQKPLHVDFGHQFAN